MAGRPWVLEEIDWTTVRDTAYEVAVLPWGATEAHNTHLPYGTDNLETVRIAAAAAQAAWMQGARVVVLPTIPFGVNTQQLDIPLTLNLNPSTQALVLRDIVNSLDGHGVRKLLILNGHGGNDFRAMIRELQPATRLFLCTANWYQSVPAADYFEEPGDHAGELETSLILHLAPDLVRSLDQAGSGRARSFRFDAIRQGWAWAPRRWTQITEDTGVGDPRAASAEKGNVYFAAVTSVLAAFLVDLAAADDVYI
ncbi:MAG: creatininase family protein [Longimicrobiales bacterium]